MLTWKRDEVSTASRRQLAAFRPFSGFQFNFTWFGKELEEIVWIPFKSIIFQRGFCLRKCSSKQNANWWKFIILAAYSPREVEVLINILMTASKLLAWSVDVHNLGSVSHLVSLTFSNLAKISWNQDAANTKMTTKKLVKSAPKPVKLGWDELLLNRESCCDGEQLFNWLMLRWCRSSFQLSRKRLLTASEWKLMAWGSSFNL